MVLSRLQNDRSFPLKWPTEAQISYCLEVAEIPKNSNDEQFLRRMFDGGPQRYVRRLRRLGFTEMESVLDAGSGFGQWSVVLAQLNQKVVAFDASPVRVAFLDCMVSELEIINVETHICELPNIPTPYTPFDGVFCFGTIFLSPWKTSLEKLVLSLAPESIFYVNANDLGWHLYLYETNWNSADDYLPRETLANSLLKTDTYIKQGTVSQTRGHIIVSAIELRLELKRFGFTSIRQGKDGVVSLNFLRKRFLRSRFFPGTYKGFDAVHEALASFQLR